jgi:hypothetical protein
MSPAKIACIEDYFIPIELPQAVEQALSLTAERSLQQTPA